MDPKLNGSVVLVTGGSGGIGSEVVRAFAAEGAAVAIHFHSNEDAAKTLQSELAPINNCIMTICADLTQEEEVRRLWEAVEHKLGPIEIVVANAGVFQASYTPLQQMSLRQWNDTLAQNLTSIFLCLREFFRKIEQFQIEAPAAVIIGSTSGMWGDPGHCDYAASKAGAIYGLLPTLKDEIARMAPRGRINAVSPGWIVTKMADSFLKDPEQVKRSLQTAPLRKLGLPVDVAAAVLFLASNALSGHLSGEIIRVSGGKEGRVLYDIDEI